MAECNVLFFLLSPWGFLQQGDRHFLVVGNNTPSLPFLFNPS